MSRIVHATRLVFFLNRVISDNGFSLIRQILSCHTYSLTGDNAMDVIRSWTRDDKTFTTVEKRMRPNNEHVVHDANWRYWQKSNEVDRWN